MKKKLSIIIAFTLCFFATYVKGQDSNWEIEVQHGINAEIKYQGLQGVFFLDNTYGWLSGGNGLIKKTSDGGITWLDLMIPQSDWLNTIFFLDSNTGWVSDIESKNLFHTTDGGKTWEKISIEGLDEYGRPIEKLLFLTKKNGFMIIRGIFFETQNGGRTWTKKLSEDKYFTSFCFIDKNNGWVLHRLGAYKTINGGKNWTEVKNLSLKMDNKGWGSYPYWKEGILTEISFLDLQHGIISAAMPDTLGYLLITSDGGKTWHKKAGPENLLNTSYAIEEELLMPEQFYIQLKIHYIDKQNIYFSTYRNVYYSSDGSNNFSKINTNYYPNYSWNNIHFVTKDKAFIVSGIGLFHTENMGETWIPNNDIPPQYMRNVFFINSNIGWAVGNGGVLLKTINGGKSWESQVSNTLNNLLSVMFLTPSIGWITSEKGEILHTKDGGDHWKIQTIKKDIKEEDDFQLKHLLEFYPNHQYPPIFSSKVSMVDLRFGWLLGESPERIEDPKCIYYTEDGGITWKEVENNENIDFIDIYFQDKINAYAVSSNSLYQSKDGCRTWQEIDLKIQNLSLSGIQRVNSSELILMSQNSVFNYNTISKEIKEIEIPSRGSGRDNVYFLTRELGWYIMQPHSPPNVYETLNGGNNWTSIMPNNSIFHNILSHFVLNENHIWLVGQNGLIIKLTNSQERKQEDRFNELKGNLNNIRNIIKR